jgi:sn-glycerol 3-phosphate transport system substrate-binding protein
MSRILTPSRRNVLLAGAAGALSVPILSACGGSATADGGGYAQPAGETPAEYADRQRVVMWYPWGGKSGEALIASTTAFNESQTDIYVELQQFDGYDGTETKYAAALQAKEIPTIIALGDVSWHRFFLNETLEPLDDYFDAEFTPEVYNPTLFQEGQLNGSTWWLPQGRSTPLFYYNKDVFEAVGLPDRAPETWTEFREWGKELTGFVHNGNEMKMRAYGITDDWYLQGLMWNFGGAYSDENLNLTLTEQGAIDALEFDRQIINQDGSGYVAQDPGLDFTTGLAATLTQSTGSLGGITESAEFAFGTGFLPAEVEAAVPTGGGGISLSRYASQENKDAAWEFLKFLASPEQSTAWTLASGYLPNTVAAAKSAEFATRVEEQPPFGVALEQLNAIARQPDTARMFVPATVPEMRTVIQRVYSDNEDPATVLADAAAAIEESAAPIRDTFEEVMNG